MQSLKNWLNDFFADDEHSNDELKNRLRESEIIIVQQRAAINEKQIQVSNLEKKLEDISVNGGYGYRAQHIEHLNKEVLRLGNLCRELSENNEKLNNENMKLEFGSRKSKKKKNDNE